MSVEKGSNNVDEANSVHDAPEKPNQFLEEQIVYPTGLKLVAIIVALCLVAFLVALDQTIIATAIPKITDHFDSVRDIGWYGSVRGAIIFERRVSNHLRRLIS